MDMNPGKIKGSQSGNRPIGIITVNNHKYDNCEDNVKGMDTLSYPQKYLK